MMMWSLNLYWWQVSGMALLLLGSGTIENHGRLMRIERHGESIDHPSSSVSSEGTMTYLPSAIIHFFGYVMLSI